MGISQLTNVKTFTFNLIQSIHYIYIHMYTSRMDRYLKVQI